MELYGVSFPINVQIQTSNKCNAACSFCPYPYTEGKKDFQKMDWKLYKKIIDECALHNINEVLPFFLNEPLLNNDLVKYINYAKEKNVNSTIKIFSNGSLMTETMAVKLIDSQIDEVIFSFNGSTPSEYEQFMKGLDFEETKARITNFIRLKGEREKPLVTIHMLKVGLSDGSLDNIRRYWNDLGVTVHLLKYENRAGNVMAYNIISDPSVVKIACARLMNQIYILLNGDVVLCCADWKNEVIFGNLNHQTIEEIWSGEKRQAYLNAHLKGEFNKLKLCSTCNFNEVKL